MKHLPDGSMDQMIQPSSPQLLGDPACVILAQLLENVIRSNTGTVKMTKMLMGTVFKPPFPTSHYIHQVFTSKLGLFLVTFLGQQ